MPDQKCALKQELPNRVYWFYHKESTMTQQDMLETLEEGVKNGRIAPHLAAFIAAELLGTEAHETDFDDSVRTADDGR